MVIERRRVPIGSPKSEPQLGHQNGRARLGIEHSITMSKRVEPNAILGSSSGGSPCEPADPNARIEPEQRFISPMKSPEHQKREIIQYLHGQAHGEEVVHLEKVTSEVIYGQEHAVWDVRTDKNDWWVVTNPTNLYFKRTFPSVDMLMSFHVGLAARLFGRTSAVEDAEEPTLLRTLRRLDVVSVALDDAAEAEDYQAIGVRCREALLSLVRDLADPNMLARDQEEPKLGDFIHWSEIIANWATPNPSLSRMRSYLKTIARETWQLVNWVTHSTSASEEHTAFAYRATSNVVMAFSAASRRRDEVETKRCPACDSYQLFDDFLPDEWAEVTLCEACGAEGPLRPVPDQPLA